MPTAVLEYRDVKYIETMTARSGMSRCRCSGHWRCTLHTRKCTKTHTQPIYIVWCSVYCTLFSVVYTVVHYTVVYRVQKSY